MVRVTIANTGDDPYKPELYGDRIILERSISMTSSKTVLKNAAGQIVDKGNKELDILTDHLNVDVDNPMCELFF